MDLNLGFSLFFSANVANQRRGLPRTLDLSCWTVSLILLIFLAKPVPPQSSCSQNLMTFQPQVRSERFTSPSRCTFLATFRFQYARFDAGMRQCCGQPCQKHPSTNTATRRDGKTKSGLPINGNPRLHPLTPCCLKMSSMASSVLRLPLKRTCAMTRDLTDGGMLSMACHIRMNVRGRLLKSFASRAAFGGILAAWSNLLKSVSP